jgi:hypothetical protein
MYTFSESRWRTPLPWLLLSLVLVAISFVQLPFIITYCEWPLRFAAGVTCVWSLWKIGRPGKVVVFETGGILIKGVRPGWWKLFQRWNWVRINDEHVEGMKLPPIGEPSRGGFFQNFLWIHYKSGNGDSEIYYPNIYDIQNSNVLIAQLKERFGEKVKTYPSAE